MVTLQECKNPNYHLSISKLPISSPKLIGIVKILDLGNKAIKPFLVHFKKLPTEYLRFLQKVSSHVVSKIETFIEEDTRNIVPRTMMPQSPSKLAPWGLTQFSQLLSAAPFYFPDSHWLKSLPFQR